MSLIVSVFWRHIVIKVKREAEGMKRYFTSLLLFSAQARRANFASQNLSGEDDLDHLFNTAPQTSLQNHKAPAGAELFILLRLPLSKTGWRATMLPSLAAVILMPHPWVTFMLILFYSFLLSVLLRWALFLQHKKHSWPTATIWVNWFLNAGLKKILLFLIIHIIKDVLMGQYHLK